MRAMAPLRSPSATLSSVLLQLSPAVLLCFLFAAVGVLHVTSRVRIVSVGYELSQLEKEHRALTHENARLKLELATLKSPTRLERIAREQLAMAPPPASSIVLLQPSAPALGRASAAAPRHANDATPRVAARAVKEAEAKSP